jgi:hypothetical protein
VEGRQGWVTSTRLHYSILQRMEPPEKLARAARVLRIAKHLASVYYLSSVLVSGAEALEGTLKVETDWVRWKACAAAARPKPGAPSAVEAPKWNPTAPELQPIEETFSFISSQQAKDVKKRQARWKEQKSTVFSEMYGLHFGEGSLPGDGMQGLARGEDEERQFDAPLKVMPCWTESRFLSEEQAVSIKLGPSNPCQQVNALVCGGIALYGE